MDTEINGHKFEISEQVAVRVDTLKVGSRVRVLHKPSYGDPKVYSGVVVGFEPFPSLPTVLVAYVEAEYSSTKVKVVPFNANTKDMELVANAPDAETLDYEAAVYYLDKKVTECEAALETAKDQRAFFVKHWAHATGEAAPVEAK